MTWKLLLIAIAFCRGNSIVIEDARSHKIIHILAGHQAPVTMLAVDSVHGLLASKSMDGTIRIWDLATGKTVEVFTVHRPDDSPMTFSRDGNAFAFVDAGILQVKDIYSWESFVTAGFLPRVLSLNFIHDDQWLAIGKAKDGRVRIYDLSTGSPGLRDTLIDMHLLDTRKQGTKMLLNMVLTRDRPEKSGTSAGKPGFVIQNGHSVQVVAIQRSEDDRYLFSLDVHGTVIVWDNVSGLILKRLSTGITRCSPAKLIVRKDKISIAADYGGHVIVEVWDWRKGRKEKENLLSGESSNWYTDDNYLFLLQFYATKPAATVLYDLQRDSIVRAFPVLWDATLSPKGDRIAAFQTRQKGLDIYGFPSGIKVDSLPELFYGDSAHYNKIKFGDNDDVIGLGERSGGRFEIWDLSKHRLCFHQQEFLSDFAINETQGEVTISSLTDLFNSHMVIRSLWSGTLNKDFRERFVKQPIAFLKYDRRKRLYLGDFSGALYSVGGNSDLDFGYYPPGHDQLQELSYDSAGDRLLIKENLIHSLDIAAISCTRIIDNEFLTRQTILDQGGKSVAYYAPVVKAIIINGADGGQRLIPVQDTILRLLLWDSRRSLMAYQTGGKELIVEDQRLGGRIQIALPAGLEVEEIAVSSNGSQVAFAGNSDTLFLYNKAQPDSLQEIDRGEYTHLNNKLVFSADDRYLISYGVVAPAVYSTADVRKHFLLGGAGLGVGGIVTDGMEADHLLACSQDGYVRTFSLKTGKIIDAYNLHVPLSHICRGDGSAIYYVISDNSMIYRFDLNRKVLLDIFYPNNGACLISDSSGNYMTTDHSFRDFGFTLYDHCYGLDQFDGFFNRPDKVLRTFGFIDSGTVAWYRRVVDRRARETGTISLSFKRLAEMPQLTIGTWKLDTIADVARITLSGTSEKPLKAIRVRVNGNPVWEPGYRIEGAIRRVRTTISVALNTGLNRIQISLVNTTGEESLRQLLTIRYPRKNKTDLYFIGIGASAYKYSDTLRCVDNDVDTLVSCFRQAAGKWFDGLKIDTFLNGSVTKARLRGFSHFLKAGKANDIVVLYYAGHGMLVNDSAYYLASYDMDFRHPEESGISYDELEHALDSIPERKKLVIINACHSGEVDSDPVVYAKMRMLFSDLRPSNGVTVMAAAAGNSNALIPADQGLSNMGLALRMAFRGMPNRTRRVADSNHDGQVMVNELIDFLAETVSELSHGRQLPSIRRQNAENNFRIW